jgi:energy-coupling factor transporter transmembrane protein EcfT
MSRRWLRRVHPLLKLGAATAWLAAAVLLPDPAALAVLSVGTVGLALTAGVGRHWKPALGAAAGLTALGGLHLLIGGSPTQAFVTTARLLVFAGIGAVLTLSTDPMDLLRSLARLPIPSSIRLGLHLLWRSVGVLFRELAAIRFAARADGQQRLLVSPARGFRYVLIPFAFALTGYADEVALALQSRGVRLDAPRVAPSPRPWGAPDLWFGLAALAVLCGAALASRSPVL